MRKDEVSGLIEHSEKKLSEIEDNYKKALRSKNIPTSLQIDVKNFMENLRSALDYMAHDIYDSIIRPHRDANGLSQIDEKNIYFPYGKQTENDFRSRIGSTLPDLETLSPPLFLVLNAIQKFKSGESWLPDFCDILNQKKHNSLKPQTREVQKGLNIDFGGGTGIKMGPGASISGSGMISSGNSKIVLSNDVVSGDSPARNIFGDVKQTIVEWVSFRFDGTNIVVLDFLKKSLKEIGALKDKIYFEF
jgi:hypothetical protein